MKLNLTSDRLHVSYSCSDTRHDDILILDILKDLIDLLNNHEDVDLNIQSIEHQETADSEEHPVQNKDYLI